MMSLTTRQAQVLRFIQGFQEANGWSPNFEEMKAGIGAGNKSTVASLIDGLEERGAIQRLHSRARAIRVLHSIAIPRAPDGAPLFAVVGRAGVDRPALGGNGSVKNEPCSNSFHGQEG